MESFSIGSLTQFTNRGKKRASAHYVVRLLWTPKLKHGVVTPRTMWRLQKHRVFSLMRNGKYLFLPRKRTLLDDEYIFFQLLVQAPLYLSYGSLS